MNICVVALGQMGLPLGVQFASKGHAVTGVDVNARTVDLVNAGLEPFPGEADLGEKPSLVVSAGLLRATTDYGDAVSSPVDAAVIQADHAECKHIRPADLPGIRVLVDGRAVTDETLWRGVRPLVVGTAPGRGE